MTTLRRAFSPNCVVGGGLLDAAALNVSALPWN
jgi:hypothetical protein